MSTKNPCNENVLNGLERLSNEAQICFVDLVGNITCLSFNSQNFKAK